MGSPDRSARSETRWTGPINRINGRNRPSSTVAIASAGGYVGTNGVKSATPGSGQSSRGAELRASR
jgi:hypothetical protein